MKKALAVILTVFLLAGFTACTKKTQPEPEPVLPKVVFIAADGGLEGNRYNTSAYEGVKEAQKDYDLEVSVLEPTTGKEYSAALSEAAAGGAKLVIGTGYISKTTMKKIAEANPDTLFALLDYQEEIAGNVLSLAYKEQEGAFVVGVIAALTSQSRIVGFVGGEDTAILEKYEYGFRAGVKAIDANVQVISQATGTFIDPEAGKTAAQALIAAGADVIFHEAGESGDGVIAAAQAAGIWAIGADEDQSELAPETVLCSMYKQLDDGVYLAIQTMMDDEFEGGVMELGLDYQAVGYSDKAGNLPDEIREQARAYVQAICAGKIYVPAGRADFEDFIIPEGGLLAE